MAHHKEIDYLYNPGDVVYVVDAYRIHKVVIDSIVVKITKDQSFINYAVYEYHEKNNPDKKTKNVGQAFLVDDLNVAKASARINLKQMEEKATYFIDNVTDQTFDPAVTDEPTN